MSEQAITDSTIEKAPSPALEREDWLLCLTALGVSVVYFFAHTLFGPHLPGIGLTVSHWLLTAVWCLAAGRKRRLRLRGNPAGILLLLLSLAQSGVYGLYADQTLRWMNLPVLTALTWMAALTLTDGRNALSPARWTEGLRSFLPGLFRYWPLPLRALRSRKRSGGKGAEIALGLLIAIPVVTVALLLLTEADSVFLSLLRSGASAAANADASMLPKLILSLFTGLMLFSGMYSILKRQPPAELPAVRAALSDVSCAVVLICLDAVYLGFAAVQVRYLFLGTESVRMAGGYAEYARSGFFQLAALALLTLALIMPVLTVWKHSRLIRVLCAVTALLTGVIDFSAFFRMRLYIGAYGLSLLRVLTLWAMAMILLSLLAVLLKAFRPSIRVCAVLSVIVLTTWVGLNYADPDLRVAENQVSRYNAGQTDWTTIGQLIRDLSPDALPAYERIADEASRLKAHEAAADALHSADGWGRGYPAAYDWSLSWLRAAEYVSEPPR